jgi:hypothetical protein
MNDKQNEPLEFDLGFNDAASAELDFDGTDELASELFADEYEMLIPIGFDGIDGEKEEKEEDNGEIAGSTTKKVGEKPFLLTRQPLMILFKIVVILSGTYMSFILNAYSSIFFQRIFGGNASYATDFIFGISFFVTAMLYILVFELKFLEKLYRRIRKKPKIAQYALVGFSLWCAAKYMAMFHRPNHGLYPNDDTLALIERFAPDEPWMLTLLLFLPLTLIYLFFVTSFSEIIHSVLTSLTRYERIFLTLATVGGFFYIVFLFNSSSAYWRFDVMYSLDAIVNPFYLIQPTHGWTYGHYPLQPVYAMPVMLLAEPFITLHPFAVTIFRVAIQLILLQLAFVMLSRMVSKNHTVRVGTLLVLAFSFQSLVLATVVERRVMALCYLIIALYSVLYRHEKRKKCHDCEDYMWLSVAGGAIIANAYVFWASIKTWKSALKNLFLSGTTFLFILTIHGKVGGLLEIRGHVSRYEAAGWLDGGYPFTMRLTHYMYLVASSIFPPPSEEVPHPAGWQMAAWGMSEPVLGSVFFWIGVVLFLSAIAGFILNYKSRFAQVAIVSVAVSAAFVLVNGLNMDENAVVLNTMFYGWAFVALAIMGFDKLIKSTNVKRAFLWALVAATLTWNLGMVMQVYEFAVTHFHH